MIDTTHYRRLLTRAVLLPLLTMVLLASLLLWQVLNLRGAASLVDRADRVIDQANLTLKLAVDAETGQRGFLVGGERLFLEPYLDAEQEITPALDTLAQLTVDNPPQEARVQQLRTAFAQWDKTAQREMAARTHGPDYQRVFNQANGKKQMDALRAQIALFIAEEAALRRHRAEAATLATRFTLVTAGLVTLLLGALLAFQTRRALLSLSASYATALNQVQEREQWLFTTLTSIGDAVMATDIEGRITFLNPIAERLTGWSQGEARGKESTQVFHIVNEDTRAPVENPLVRVLRDGTVVGLANHTILIHKDETERPIDDSGAPIRDAKGNLLGAVLVFRDISERKEREQLTQEANRRVTEILQSITDGFCALDAQWLFTYINPQGERILGRTHKELIGQSLWEALPAALDAPFASHFHQAVTERVPVRFEAHYPPLDAWLEIRAFPLPEGGLSVFFQNITARHRYEQEILTLNQRLQKAMEETHHRVRNNLQMIAAMVDMQKMEYAQTVPTEELTRLSAHIRTLGAIHDLLTEQAKKDGQAHFLSVKEVLDKLLPMLQQTAPTRHIRFEIEDAILPTRQATSLALITNELVTNAIKYGKYEIRIDFTVQDNVGALSVRDDGPGLPEEFDPVRSAHTGLALVENLSRWDLRGLTRYTNEGNSGACVTVTLPLVAPSGIFHSA